MVLGWDQFGVSKMAEKRARKCQVTGHEAATSTIYLMALDMKRFPDETAVVEAAQKLPL